MAYALVTVREIKRPYSERETGLFKYVAAVPNMAGSRFGVECPSFQKPYFILESSQIPADVEEAEHFFKNFEERLRFLGYTELERV